MAAILQAIGKFCWMKIDEFRLESHWSLLLACNQQYSSIVSDIGYAPGRRQAINGTQVGIAYRRIYALLGHNELTGLRQRQITVVIHAWNSCSQTDVC